MITAFIVDNDFKQLYFVGSDNYSALLQRLNIEPERVQFRTVPVESLLMLVDNQVEYIMREN